MALLKIVIQIYWFIFKSGSPLYETLSVCLSFYINLFLIIAQLTQIEQQTTFFLNFFIIPRRHSFSYSFYFPVNLWWSFLYYRVSFNFLKTPGTYSSTDLFMSLFIWSIYVYFNYVGTYIILYGSQGCTCNLVHAWGYDVCVCRNQERLNCEFWKRWKRMFYYKIKPKKRG